MAKYTATKKLRLARERWAGNSAAGEKGPNRKARRIAGSKSAAKRLKSLNKSKEKAVQIAALPHAKIERLEPRILLAGDVPLDGVDQVEPGLMDLITVSTDGLTNDTGVDGPAPINVNYDPAVGILPEITAGEAASAVLATIENRNNLNGDIHLTADNALDGSAFAIDDGERLTGSGMISGDLLVDGDHAPGNSPGIQTIAGNYTLTDDGLVEIEIGGLTAGAGQNGNVNDGFDQINVGGTADLAGMLKLVILDDFAPEIGTEFDILTYSDHSGEFDTLMGLYIGEGKMLRPVYGDDGLTLVVAAVPGLHDANGDVVDTTALDAAMSFLNLPLDATGGVDPALDLLDSKLVALHDMLGGGAPVTLDLALAFAGQELSATADISIDPASTFDPLDPAATIDDLILNVSSDNAALGLDAGVASADITATAVDMQIRFDGGAPIFAVSMTGSVGLDGLSGLVEIDAPTATLSLNEFSEAINLGGEDLAANAGLKVTASDATFLIGDAIEATIDMAITHQLPAATGDAGKLLIGLTGGQLSAFGAGAGDLALTLDNVVGAILVTNKADGTAGVGLDLGGHATFSGFNGAPFGLTAGTSSSPAELSLNLNTLGVAIDEVVPVVAGDTGLQLAADAGNAPIFTATNVAMSLPVGSLSGDLRVAVTTTDHDTNNDGTADQQSRLIDISFQNADGALRAISGDLAQIVTVSDGTAGLIYMQTVDLDTGAADAADFAGLVNGQVNVTGLDAISISGDATIVFGKTADGYNHEFTFADGTTQALDIEQGTFVTIDGTALEVVVDQIAAVSGDVFIRLGDRIESFDGEPAALMREVEVRAQSVSAQINAFAGSEFALEGADILLASLTQISDQTKTATALDVAAEGVSFSALDFELSGADVTARTAQGEAIDWSGLGYDPLGALALDYTLADAGDWLIAGNLALAVGGVARASGALEVRRDLGRFVAYSNGTQRMDLLQVTSGGGTGDVLIGYDSADGPVGLAFDSSINILFADNQLGRQYVAFGAEAAAINVSGLDGIDFAVADGGAVTVAVNIETTSAAKTDNYLDFSNSALMADFGFDDTVFNQGLMSAAGELTLDIIDLVAVDGNFGFKVETVNGEQQLQVLADGVNAELGQNGVGAALNGGTLAAIITEDGHALTANGAVTLSGGIGAGLVAQGTIEVNTSHNAINQVIDIAGFGGTLDDRTVAFDSDAYVARIIQEDVQLTLEDQLIDAFFDAGTAVKDLAQSVGIQIDADGIPVYDDDGNLQTKGVLSDSLPFIGSSIDDLLGTGSNDRSHLTNILSFGDYVQHYMAPAKFPEQFAAQNDPFGPPPAAGGEFAQIDGIPVGDYELYGTEASDGEGGTHFVPTLEGMLAFMNDNWVPLVAEAGNLNITLTDQGIELTFQDSISHAQDLPIDLNEPLADLGLSAADTHPKAGLQLEDPVVASLTSIADIAFGLVVDWASTPESATVDFDLQKLDVSIEGAIDDFALDGILGPLGVAIGKDGAEFGTGSLTLGAAVNVAEDGSLSIDQTEDSFILDLPIYADFAGVDLTGDEPPRVIVEGSPFAFAEFEPSAATPENPFMSVTTENMDKLSGFTDMSIFDLIEMFPSMVDVLEQVAQSDNFFTAIPFTDAALNTLLDFAQAFESGVYDPIGFNQFQSQLATFTGLSIVTSTDAQGVVSTIATADFSAIADDLKGGVLSINGVDYAVLDIAEDGQSLHLADAESLGSGTFDAAANEVRSVRTLQETIEQIDRSGVLPDGVSITYDPVLNLLTLPMAFSQNVDAGTLPIDLDFAFPGLALSTDQALAVTGNVESQFGLFVDFDGADGTQSIPTFGVTDLAMNATLTLDKEDPEITALLGLLGATAGGSGTGSSLEASVNIDIDAKSLDGSGRLSFDDLSSGAFDLSVTPTGEAHAILNGLTIDTGILGSIDLGDFARIELHALDIFAPGAAQTIYVESGTTTDIDALVEAGTIAADGLVAILPDVNAAFDFNSLSFEDILAAVQMGIDFVQDSLDDQPLYNTELPLINRSVSDLVNFTETLNDALIAVADDPGQTVQSFEALFEDALGIVDDNTAGFYDQAFALRLNENVVDIHFSFDQMFEEVLDFSFDIATMAEAAGLGDASALDGLSMLADITGASRLDLAALLEIQIDAGIAITDNAPELFLYDYVEDGIGTQARLGVRAEGTDLELNFKVAGIGIGVEDGFAVFDGDGTVGGGDFATAALLLDQIGGTDDDGRYYFDEALTDNLKLETTGAMAMELPLRLDILGQEFNEADLQSFLQEGQRLALIADGARFVELMEAIANGTPAAEDIFTLEFPDIAGIIENLAGDLNILTLLNDPGILIDGIDFALGGLQDVFVDGFAGNIPLIGNALADQAGFIADIRQGLLKDMRDTLSSNGGTIEHTQNIMFSLFNDVLGILQDGNEDGTVDKDDVLVTWRDGVGNSIGIWDGSAPPQDANGNLADAVQFDVALGGDIVGTSFDIPLDIGLPGFGLDIDGGFGLAADWTLDLGFGLSTSDGVYLVDTGAEEAQFNVEVFLDGPGDAPFSGSGELLFFDLRVVDNKPNDRPSGLYGSFTVDMLGNQDTGRLTTNDLLGSDLGKIFVADFALDGELDLAATLSVDEIAILPKLMTDIKIDWDWSLSEGAGAPDIMFDDLRIDVSSFVGSFLKPIGDQVNAILEPMRPVIEALETSIPLGFIGIDNVMDLIDTLMRLQGRDPINWSFIEAANFMLNELPGIIDGITDTGVIYLGDITGLGTPNVGKIEGDLALGDASFGAPSANLENTMGQIEASSKGSTSDRSGFRVFEYVKDFDNWFNLLTGGNATLFTYEMPLLEFEAAVDVPIAGFKLGPAKFGIMGFGELSAFADLAFGFDTVGVRKALDTGNPLDVMDSFFVSDFTMPSFAGGGIIPESGGQEKPEFGIGIKTGIEAGVDAGIVSAGLQGAIEFTAEFDMQDIDKSELTKNDEGYVTSVNYTSDGRIRLSELATLWDNGGFENLFDVEAVTSLLVSAYVDVSFPLIGSKTIIEVDLIDEELFSFSHEAESPRPVLATQSGSTLVVNAGPNASAREFFNTSDGNEVVYLYDAGSNGVAVEFDGWYQEFSGVNNVVIDLGAGDDVLDATRMTNATVTAFGGSGNDILLGGALGGTMQGGAGDDILTALKGSFGAVHLYGNSGIDVLTGAGGNDTLVGGAGNDTLSGNDGDDDLEGGTGTDMIDGGRGVDLFRFADSYGTDKLRDDRSEIRLDFSAVTSDLQADLSRRSFQIVNEEGHEARIRGEVVDITFGSGDDNVRVKDFPDWDLTLRDGGGSDNYRITMGRAASGLDDGTVIIDDTSGSFDEIIVEQTQIANPLTVDLDVVENGREFISYNNGQIERLTVKGKGSELDDIGVEALKGTSIIIDKDGVGDANAIDLGNTGLRLVGHDAIIDAAAVNAAHIIIEELSDITIDQEMTATEYIDLRTYADNADIIQTADMTVLNGWNEGAMTGWMRLQAADGSVLNPGDNLIKAAQGYLQVRAKDAIGTLDHELRTEVAEASLFTEQSGLGDIVLVETDHLTIRTETYLFDEENEGYRIVTGTAEDRWESKTDWAAALSDEWRNHLLGTRDNFAVEAEHGDIYLTLLDEDARLTLASGVLKAGGQFADITLVTDDVDFLSGREMVIASGDFSLMAEKLAWKYFLGYAAESPSGVQLADDNFVQLPDGTIQSDHRQAMDVSTKDLAALADGFANIIIGRSGPGNIMTLGDAKLTEFAPDPIGGPNPRPLDDQESSFRDDTQLLAEYVYVRGDVQANSNKLTVDARAMQVNAKNLHDPLGPSNSGLSAGQIDLNVSEQLDVGGWLIAEELITIDVDSTNGTDNFFTPPYGLNSLLTNIGSLIETSQDGSAIQIHTSASQELAGVIEAHGAGSSILMDAGGPLLLKEGGLIAARGALASISLLSDDVVAINSGSAVTAGAEFVTIDGKDVAQITGDSASIDIQSNFALLVAGAVTASGDLSLGSDGQFYDGEAYGIVGGSHPQASAAYSIFNKQAYFADIGVTSPDHYLVDHNDGYGLLVTGTITSLQDNADLVLGSSEDVIIRGNVTANGENAAMTIQSDDWVYIEGFLTASNSLTVLGGLNATQPSVSGADARGTSLFVHETSRLRTTEAGSQVKLQGAEDVDLNGVIVAGGEIGENGVIWNGTGSTALVAAGQQLLVNSGVLASEAVTFTSGTAGADDDDLSMIITTAGGATAAGFADNGQTSAVTVNSGGNMEVTGFLISGGSLHQEFDAQGRMIEQFIDWAMDDGVTLNGGTIDISAVGKAFVGGTAKLANGGTTTTGGFLYAASDLTISGGLSADGVGTEIHAASDVVVKDADGSISVEGRGDVIVSGRLIAGGDVVEQRDGEGNFQGADAVYDFGASTIQINADEQIIIGRDVKAGQSINIVGGVEPGAAPDEAGKGLILLGSASLSTWLENSEINLNAPGAIDILAPAQNQEIVAQGWPITAGGALTDPATLTLEIDMVSFKIEADVTITPEDTAGFTNINQLRTVLREAMAAANWIVKDSQVPAEFADGSAFTQFADDPNTPEKQNDALIDVKLQNGHLMLAGGYRMAVLDGVNADQLGFDLSAGERIDSERRYSIIADQAGSIVRIGAPDGPNGKLLISGQVLAHDAIELYSGVSPDGKDVEIGATGVLETLNGSIQFNAGVNGDIRGDVIAGGDGSDVVITGGESLTLSGGLYADDQISVSAGNDGAAGSTSVTIAGTSKIETTGPGGIITLNSVHDMSINGQIGTVGQELAALNITSQIGQIIVEEQSGRIETDAPVLIDGASVLIDGVMIVTADEGDAQSADVTINAQNSVELAGDITIDADLAVSGAIVEIYDGRVSAQTFSADATDSLTFSKLGLVDGNFVMRGAVVQVVDRADLSTAALTFGSASKLLSSGTASVIDITATSGQINGSIIGGGFDDGTTVSHIGDGASVSLFASDDLVMGDAQEYLQNGMPVAVGGAIRSTGDIVLTVGDDAAANLVQNRLSSVIAERVDAGDATFGVANIAINVTGDADLGANNAAQGQGATLAIVTGGQAQINGVTEAAASLSVTGGQDSDVDRNISVIVNPLVFTTPFGFMMDEDGRLMNQDGFLVDEQGRFVNEGGFPVPEGEPGVEGGTPVFVSGGTLDTDAGGTITIAGPGRVDLHGQIGRPQDVGGEIVINPASLTVDADEIYIGGIVNVTDTQTHSARNINILENASLTARGIAGAINLVAAENMMLADAGNDPFNPTDAAFISGNGLVMLQAELIEIGADLYSDDHILVNAGAQLTQAGFLQSGGDIDLRVGVDLSDPVMLARTDLSSADLDGGILNIVGRGQISAVDVANIVSGGALLLDSQAAIGDGTVELLTPIISTQAVQVNVITGYQQIADGTITIPKVFWEKTIVAEEVGSEDVVVGANFNTMDVTLTQDGYYNLETETKREFFVEGDNPDADYNNLTFDWAKYNVAPPVDQLATWGELNDPQREAIMKELGYIKLYDFSYTNPEIHRVINGNPTKAAWDPEWKDNERVTIHIDVPGWSDKAITLPNGAQTDLLRVVSQNEPGTFEEHVGQFRDHAVVRYDQIFSDHVVYQQSSFDRLGDSVYSSTPTQNTIDFDNEASRFAVTYEREGEREFSIFDDGRTAADGASVFRSFIPTWWDPQADTPEYLDGYTSLYNHYNDVNGIRISALEGFTDQTDFISYAGFVDAHTEFVGYTHSYQARDIVPVFGSFTRYEAFIDAQSRGGLLAAVRTDAQESDIVAVSKMNFVDEFWFGANIFKVEHHNNSNDTFYWYHGDTSFSDPLNIGGLYYDGRFDVSSSIGMLNYVMITNPIWHAHSVFQSYDIEDYNWTSKWGDVYDTRLELDYQWVSQSHDEIQARPIYETREVDTKVVKDQEITIFRNDPIIEQQTVNRAARVFDSAQVGFSDFDADAIAANFVNIDIADDALLTGRIAAMTEGGTITITTGDLLTIDGKRADGADANSLAATASLNAADAIHITSGNDFTLGRNAMLIVNDGDHVGTSEILVTTNGDAVLRGFAEAQDQIIVNADDDIAVEGTIRAGNLIELNAGRDGSGNVTGDENGTIETFIGSSVFVTAGGAAGDIILDGVTGSTGGDFNLIAASGEVSQTNGQISARDLVVSAQGPITATTNLTGNLVAASLGGGDITIDNQGDVIADLAAQDGNINFVNYGAVTLERAVIALPNDQHGIAIDVLDLENGNGLLLDGTLSATEFGDIALNVMGGFVRGANAEEIVADNLAVDLAGTAEIVARAVNSLQVNSVAPGDVTIVTGSGVVLDQINILDGDLSIVTDGDLTFNQLNVGGIASNVSLEAAGDIIASALDDAEAVNIAANELSLQAGGAIAPITVMANVLDANAASGSLSLTNIESDDDGVTDLILRDVQAGGDISIVSDGNMIANVVAADPVSGALDLHSTAGDIIIRDQGGFGGLDGFDISIVAGDLLDLEVAEDAPGTLTLIGHQALSLDTDHIFTSDRLIIESDTKLIINQPLRMTGQDLLLRAGGELILADGASVVTHVDEFGNPDGAAMTSLVIELPANRMTVNPELDPVYTLPLYTDPVTGQEYFHDIPNGHLLTEYIEGKEVWEGYERPNEDSVDPAQWVYNAYLVDADTQTVFDRNGVALTAETLSLTTLVGRTVLPETDQQIIDRLIVSLVKPVLNPTFDLGGQDFASMSILAADGGNYYGANRGILEDGFTYGFVERQNVLTLTGTGEIGHLDIVSGMDIDVTLGAVGLLDLTTLDGAVVEAGGQGQRDVMVERGLLATAITAPDPALFVDDAPDSLTAETLSGDLVLGALDLLEGVTAIAAGSIQVNDLQAQSLNLEAGSAITQLENSLIDIATDSVIAADTVSLRDVAAGNILDVTAGSFAQSDDSLITASDLSVLTNDADLIFGNMTILGTTTFSAAGAVAQHAGTALSAASALIDSDGSIQITSLSVTDNASLIAADDVIIGSVLAGDTLTIDAGGDIFQQAAAVENLVVDNLNLIIGGQQAQLAFTANRLTFEATAATTALDLLNNGDLTIADSVLNTGTVIVQTENDGGLFIEELVFNQDVDGNFVGITTEENGVLIDRLDIGANFGAIDVMTIGAFAELGDDAAPDLIVRRGVIRTDTPDHNVEIQSSAPEEVIVFRGLASHYNDDLYLYGDYEQEIDVTVEGTVFISSGAVGLIADDAIIRADSFVVTDDIAFTGDHLTLNGNLILRDNAVLSSLGDLTIDGTYHQLYDGTAVNVTDGDLVMTATEQIELSRIVSNQTITLTAHDMIDRTDDETANIVAAVLDLTATGTAGGGFVTDEQTGAGFAPAAALDLDVGELRNVDAAAANLHQIGDLLVTGQITGGDVSLFADGLLDLADGSLASTGGALTLNAGGALDLFMVAGQQVSLLAGTDITQKLAETGSLVADELNIDLGGTMDLLVSANDIGTLVSRGVDQTIAITDDDQLRLVDGVMHSGHFTITAGDKLTMDSLVIEDDHTGNRVDMVAGDGGAHIGFVDAGRRHGMANVETSGLIRETQPDDIDVDLSALFVSLTSRSILTDVETNTPFLMILPYGQTDFVDSLMTDDREYLANGGAGETVLWGQQTALLTGQEVLANDRAYIIANRTGYDADDVAVIAEMAAEIASAALIDEIVVTVLDETEAVLEDIQPTLDQVDGLVTTIIESAPNLLWPVGLVEDRVDQVSGIANTYIASATTTADNVAGILTNSVMNFLWPVDLVVDQAVEQVVPVAEPLLWPGQKAIANNVLMIGDTVLGETEPVSEDVEDAAPAVLTTATTPVTTYLEQQSDNLRTSLLG